MRDIQIGQKLIFNVVRYEGSESGKYGLKHKFIIEKDGETMVFSASDFAYDRIAGAKRFSLARTGERKFEYEPVADDITGNAGKKEEEKMKEFLNPEGIVSKEQSISIAKDVFGSKEDDKPDIQPDEYQTKVARGASWNNAFAWCLKNANSADIDEFLKNVEHIAQQIYPHQINFVNRIK